MDLKGNILHGVGWKSICTEFHRKHKISSERCLKSDTILANRLNKKEKYSIYICQNGMVDVATPIIIDGVHVANLFIGQFFFETPDKDFFIKQAEELGFDKEKYMKALEECHVYNRGCFKIVSFYYKDAFLFNSNIYFYVFSENNCAFKQCFRLLKFIF